MLTPEAFERRKAVDKVVSMSHSKAELVGNLERVGATDMAGSIEGKALFAARSPWGVLIIYGLGMALVHYGLDVSQGISELLGGAFILVGGFVMRIITHKPITGLVRPQPV